MTDKKILNVFAPAKINLFLHLTRKKQNGYHELESLISFADIGDNIEISHADNFSFKVTGAFAKNFNDREQSSDLECSNLVVMAARALSQATDKTLNVQITLTKNLPLAAGIGGGSSDAAATIWGLQQLWGLDHNTPYLLPMMTKLGADVPVCLNSRPTLVEGIGEKLLPAPDMPEIPILIVNPRVHCPTSKIFLRHSGVFKEKISLPNEFSSVFNLVDFLRQTENDLYAPAMQLVPEIRNVLNALETQCQCLFSRMTGSGASCFALFETMEGAQKAKQVVLDENPDWWAKTGWLNRPERY